MAPVGGTKNVIGNKIATPLTDPNPGIAPIKRPSAQPNTTRARFSGSKAMLKPCINRPIISTIVLQKNIVQRVEKRLAVALGQGNKQRYLEEKETDYWRAD